MNISKFAATAALMGGVILSSLSAAPMAEAKSKSGIIGSYDGDCRPGDMRHGCRPPGGGGGNHHHHHHGGGNFNFGIWLGPDPWGYGPDPYYYGPAYNYTSPYYDNDYNVQSTMTCNTAKGFLRSQGYHNVQARDCQGRTYSFYTTKKGLSYKITLNAYTGRYSRRLI